MNRKYLETAMTGGDRCDNCASILSISVTFSCFWRAFNMRCKTVLCESVSLGRDEIAWTTQNAFQNVVSIASATHIRRWLIFVESENGSSASLSGGIALNRWEEICVGHDVTVFHKLSSFVIDKAEVAVTAAGNSAATVDYNLETVWLDRKCL